MAQAAWVPAGVGLLVAVGWLAGSRLETVPRSEPRPAFDITLDSPGTGARDLEVEVLFPLEQALGRLPYVKEIESAAGPGEVKLRIWLDPAAPPAGLEQALERWRDGHSEGMPDFHITPLDARAEPTGRLLAMSGAIALGLSVVFLGFVGIILPATLVLMASVVGAVLLAQASGLTDHPLALVALIAALGLVLDDVVTVSENFVRHRELGSEARRAARLAIAEIRGGLIIGSLSLLALWAIPALVETDVLDWLRPLARVTGVSVLLSAAISLVVLPRLFPVLGDRPASSRGSKPNRLPRLAAGFDRLADRYHDRLAWALDHRRLSAALAAVLLMSVAVAAGRAGTQGPEQTAVTVQGPDASTLAGVAARIGDGVRGVPGVSRLQLSNSDGTITHRNGARVITIALELDPHFSAVASEIGRTLADIPVPPGYRVTRSAGGDEQARLYRRWAGGLLLAVVVIWVLIARHLRSWIEPLSLLPAVLLPCVGAAVAAAIAGREFGFAPLAAMVLATGIAVRQSILLLSFVRRRRFRGASLRVAVIEAARLRLRPVLVMLFAVMGAMIPLLLAAGSAGPTFGWSVTGGLILAGPAVLLLVPMLYEVLVEVEARYF
jgi:multidrug efflux pump subunit AcrB